MAMVSVVYWQPTGGLMAQADRLGPKENVEIRSLHISSSKLDGFTSNQNKNEATCCCAAFIA